MGQRLNRREAVKAMGGFALAPFLSASSDGEPNWLRAEPTVFVLKTASGAMRRVLIRTMRNSSPKPVGGSLRVSFGTHSQSTSVTAGEFIDGAYPLLVPEPDKPTELRITFDRTGERRLETKQLIPPVRKWAFYMTPHTHYDVGFFDPQLVAMDQLAKDMDTVQKFCQETANWPAESRFKWTVEVSGLMKVYRDRHSEEQVARFIDLVHEGRVEICGFYLNMHTDLCGHEELIRYLYYSQELRRQYGVAIDTAMIDDVPGYTWALADLFPKAGIARASFRANSIRGRFLWYRPGAVPRPFYWEGPEGGRVFVWYTDSYRDGSFFAEPGPHEDQFLRLIQRYEQTGYPHDEIQLRIAGDDEPPRFQASVSAKTWNEKYIWPRVLIATNREFMEVLESRHGSSTPVYRGDITNWWADGPGSSAKETGINRLSHGRMTAAETLWTAAWLNDPDTEYPRKEISEGYENMIYFDEHSWE